MKKRTELSLNPGVCNILSRIATEHDFRLAPPHAARAKREWDWAAAIEFMAFNFSDVESAVDVARDEAFAWIDSILVGGSCRYRGGVVTLEIGDQSFQKEFD